MRVLDLFSGIGAFSLGLEEAGMETVAFCEQEEFCQKVLRKHWPKVPIFEDVRKLNGKMIMGKLSKDEKLEAIKLYQKGMSLKEVADFYDVTRQAMHDMLKRRIELRSQKRFGKDNHFYRGGESMNSRAHDILEKALQKGLVKKPESGCEQCGANGRFKDGRSEVQAHHDDYNKPLDIRWLCQRCHHEWHKHNKAIDLKEVKGSVDVICGGFPC